MSASDLTGKRVIVTGANTGIGRVTAIELARRGATVLLAGRSRERTEPVLAEIRAEQGAGPAHFLEVDLGSLASIREATAKLVAEDKPLDILVNNAGLAGQRGLTKDGFELTFGTNHLGPFAFTLPLLPLLLRSGAPRVVNVSSRAHYRAKAVNYDGVKSATATTTGLPEYALSKLANVLFSNELHRRYHDRGLASYALHPGVIASDIWRRIPWPFRNIAALFMVSVEQGARTSLYCATSPDAKSGLYYNDDQRPKEVSRLVTEAAAKDLWKRSEEWTNVIASV
jgi:NAD(P)-dependent dehydrogenase (short-subunit alcohol dehydrogenase family)